MNRCECPSEAQQSFSDFWYSEEELPAASHLAGECPGTVDVALYVREGQQIWLCSCCNINGLDERVI